MIDTRIPVLIIDDYASMRGILRGMLQNIGMRNVSEDDGRQAIELVRQREFGLVISNLVMAPVSGLEMLRHVRGNPRIASMPFVLTTSVPQEALVLAAKELGVDGFLVKPFNTDALRRVVSLAIEGRAAMRAAFAASSANDEAERLQLRKDIAMLADQLQRRRALGASLLENDATGLIKSYMERAIRLGVERQCLDQLTALLKLLSVESIGEAAEEAISATGRVDRREIDRRVTRVEEPGRRQTEAELRRRHRRFVTPILHVSLGGRVYRTADWSLGGLSLGGWSGSVSAGKQLKVELAIAGYEGAPAAFADRVTVVSSRPEAGMLALRFMTHTSATLRILEYLTKRGEQALEAVPQSTGEPQS